MLYIYVRWYILSIQYHDYWGNILKNIQLYTTVIHNKHILEIALHSEFIYDIPYKYKSVKVYIFQEMVQLTPPRLPPLTLPLMS